MAHVVGVPRRDPCQKCKLPVFLAERLTVGKRTFHRTCLKCARCGSQLTPGSFYETEVDDEYCCETCPDEEEIAAASAASAASAEAESTSGVVLRNAASPEPATSSSAATRSSISARLAFFEKNTDVPSIRQASFTDEEKTRRRAALEEQPPSRATLDRERYLANDGESDDCTDKSDTWSSTAKGAGGAQMETSDTEADDDDDSSATQSGPPELPKSQPPPPPPPMMALDEPTPMPQVRTPSKRFTATAQLLLVSEQPAATDAAEAREGPADAEQNIAVVAAEERKTNHVHFNLTDSANNNNNDDNDDKAEAPAAGAAAKQSERNNVDLSPTNVRDVNVTKDKTAARDTHTAQATSQPDGLQQTKTELPRSGAADDDEDDDVELRAKPPRPHSLLSEDAATTERLSVVRARLQQFEVNANTKNNNDSLSSPKRSAKPSHSDNLNLSDCAEPRSIDDRSASPEAARESEAPPEPARETVEEVADGGDELEETKPMDIDGGESAITIAIAISEAGNEVPLGSARAEDESDSSSSKNSTAMDVEAAKPPEEEAPTAPEAADPDADRIPEGERTPPAKTTAAATATAEATASEPPPAAQDEAYPDDLNPFKSDDDDEEEEAGGANKENELNDAADGGEAGAAGGIGGAPPKAEEKANTSLNPFDSSDDEIELEKSRNSTGSIGGTPSGKVPPPRPPPPRISRNPFGEDDEADESFSRQSSLSSSITKKTPVPTPRTNLSQNPTPEPTPRLSTRTPQSLHTPSGGVLQNSSDYYGSINSLSGGSSAATTPLALLRNSEARGSNHSLTSSAGGTIRSRKSRRAPAPPLPVKELFPSTETVDGSKTSTSTPSSSNMGSPRSNRKKRPAPAPPKPARLDPSQLPAIMLEQVAGALSEETNDSVSKNLLSYPLQSDLNSKLSDEEKAVLEGKQKAASPPTTSKATLGADASMRSVRSSLRLIPLDPSLLEDLGAERSGQCDDVKHQLAEEETNVVYRRVLVPPSLGTPVHEANPLLDELNLAAHDRQLEKLKDNKEAQNRNRQSQHSAASSGTEDGDGASALYSNKSSHGKWKRRKGPAPALPIPPRRVLQMLPLQEIRHELDIIEVQQQGLEKQGVILEKMIRDRCEGQNGEPLGLATPPTAAHEVGDGRTTTTASAEHMPNSKEVEDLILQLFELVNEKNELFRRQAELMYLRRQHRLEQEQADLEYEIRVLMAQPERNKTDSDKSREEALIARLVEVVQLRNEVIDCLEMDRLREAEEDLSIKQRLELHTAQRESDEESKKSSLKLLSKKEKKKHKESKKLSKSKKIDADKDADETELSATDKAKQKKKKRKFLF